MPEETIKEFLVSLGWVNNEAQERRITTALEGATLRAKLLGDTIETMAGTVGNKVIAVSTKFEDLYFMSARVKASSENIQAFEYAISRSGGTVEGARASIEAFAELMRENPSGWEKYVNNLGVRTREANGDLRDQVLVLMDVGKAIGAMPKSGQEQLYAKQFGFTKEVLDGISKYTEFLRLFDERQASIDAAHRQGESPEQDAEDAHKFENTWNDIWARLGDVGDAAGARMMRATQKPLDAIDAWLAKHEHDIAMVIADLTEHASQLGGQVASEAGLEIQLVTGIWNLYAHPKRPWGAQLLYELGLGGDAGVPAGIAKPTSLMINGAPVSPANPLPTQEQGGFWSQIGSAIMGLPGAIAAAISSLTGGGGGANNGVGDWWTAERMKHAASYLQTNAGLSAVGAAALVARWAGIEAPGGPDSANASGHVGIAQWDAARGGEAMRGASFDEQLAHAAQELNTTEKAAGNVLRAATTPGEGARGASMFERAEQYNAATGEDAWTGRTPVDKVLAAIRAPSPPSLAGDLSAAFAAPAEATPAQRGGITFEGTGSPIGAVHWDEDKPYGDLSGWRVPNQQPYGDLAGIHFPQPSGDVDNSSTSANVNQKIDIHFGDVADVGQVAPPMIGMHIQRTNSDWTRNLQGAAQ